jgi:hypothetical protein
MADIDPNIGYNPAWFEPQPNQTEYTQGYYKGRIDERQKIVDMLMFDFAMFAPFHPVIGDQIMDTLKRVDPVAHAAFQIKVDEAKAARKHA